MFGNRLTLFDLFGFKVRIDASWLLLAGLIVWSLAGGYFPLAAPGFEPATYWVMGLVGLVGLALSIVLHELSHALVARRYDIPIVGITLFVFGGVAEMHEEPKTAKGEFLMAIAGPLASVAIAVLAYAAAAVSVRLGIELGNPAVVVLGYLALINLLLAAFNMIPAFPLDGGRVLRAALWAWKKDILWATRMATGSGTVLGFVLMGAGIWTALTGAVLAGAWWFIIGVFVRAAAMQAYRQELSRREGRAVTDFMRADPVTVSPGLTLEALVDGVFIRHPHGSYPVVDDEGCLVGCVTLDAVRGVVRSEWAHRRVAEVMEPCEPALISVAADAGEALRRMRVTGRSRLMVMRGERLVGVLSLKDLLQFLALSSDRRARPG